VYTFGILTILLSGINSWAAGRFAGRAERQRLILFRYAWLIRQYQLTVPTPPRLAGISGSHRPRERDGWCLLPAQYAPEAELSGQLSFALKREGVNLAVLDALFKTVSADDIAAVVKRTVTGAQSRRIWFLYEWLQDSRLDLPDSGLVKAVPVVDPKRQFGLLSGELSVRHRVRNNLPGTRQFCPMVRKTPLLEQLSGAGYAERARAVTGRVHPDLLSRAAAFLLLSDSRASYNIESENPSADRVQRWAECIATAGATRLSAQALEDLQRTVIGDSRFVQMGLRTEGGFVGEHDRDKGWPLPVHISANAADLPSLVSGIVEYDARAGRGAMDPVVAAAVEAFGFVYVHPFEDGNGRVHRWLLHHVLSASGFAPEGIVFPVSAVMLREIVEYRKTLETYSKRLLPLIDWRATEDGNVEVLNDTVSWYRYFDATAHAEYLYRCVQTTIETDLPAEVDYLRAFDWFSDRVSAIVDMPRRTLDLLHRFLRQNNGLLSARAREKEFAKLTPDEVVRVEALYAESATALPSMRMPTMMTMPMVDPPLI
jgi:hypothetical protein